MNQRKFKRLTEIEKQQIITMYLNNTKIKDIASLLNRNQTTIQDLIRKNKLTKTNPMNMIKRYNIKEYIRENNKTYFIKECTICKKDKKILSSAITLQNKDTWCCIDCYLKTDKINKELANKKKKKSNKSGYIGVFPRTLHGKILGYKSVIRYENKTLLDNMYKDETLNEKTLIQAVLDRDIFIIEKQLPHRRNFTDVELFANMKYLAYEQIDHIKNILDTRINS